MLEDSLDPKNPPTTMKFMMRDDFKYVENAACSFNTVFLKMQKICI